MKSIEDLIEAYGAARIDSYTCGGDFGTAEKEGQAYEDLFSAILADKKDGYIPPIGYALVPNRPTKEMQDAWDSSPNNEDIDVEFRQAYGKMIDAAPKVEPK